MAPEGGGGSPGEGRLKPFERRQTLDVAGVSTPVFEAGSGREVLFLHGNPDSHDIWGPVIERLQRDNPGKYRCIAPDIPGYGESRAPDDIDYSLEGQAKWVDALVTRLGLSKVDLVIHDVGNTYGCAFVVKHPEKVRSLTLFNGAFFRDSPWHFWAKVWRTPVLGEIAMAVATRFLFVSEMRKGGPRLPEDYPAHAWSQYSMHTRKHVLKWYREMDFAKVLVGWDDQLKAIIPTLKTQVIWGNKDTYILPDNAEKYGAPLTRFDDAGHWVMQERPDDSAELIGKLLAASA